MTKSTTRQTADQEFVGDVSVDGLVTATRDGSSAAVFRRLTSDGDIIEFRKDGATVGSIRTDGGYARIVGGNGSVGSGLSLNNLTVNPVGANGSISDGAVKLGDWDSRFTDLYLSGGVYLGGTGAANKLDDYEEGTWTPNDNNISYTNQIGRYEKIGRLVSISGYFVVPSNTNGNTADILLPFNYSEGITLFILCDVSCTDGSNSGIKGRFDNLGTGSAYISIVNSNESYVLLSELSGKSIRFNAVYRTNS